MLARFVALILVIFTFSFIILCEQKGTVQRLGSANDLSHYFVKVSGNPDQLLFPYL